MSNQITAVEKDPTQVDSPISVAIDLGVLRSSQKPFDSTLVEIVSLLQEIKAEQQREKSAVGRKALVWEMMRQELVSANQSAKLKGYPKTEGLNAFKVFLSHASEQAPDPIPGENAGEEGE